MSDDPWDDPTRCSHCIMSVMPNASGGWTHTDNDPTCVDFWQSSAKPLDAERALAYYASEKAGSTAGGDRA